MNYTLRNFCQVDMSFLCIIVVTGRAHCQRQVAFLADFSATEGRVFKQSAKGRVLSNKCVPEKVPNVKICTKLAKFLALSARIHGCIAFLSNRFVTEGSFFMNLCQ